MQTIPEVLTFVDVETTGGSPENSRILEIGIWRTENGILVDSLITLLDPDSYFDPWILRMTGIDEGEVLRSPTFRSIENKVTKILDNAVFVAHSARFDLGFFKTEFRRLGTTFEPPVLCTAKLLRRLRPDLKKANLDVLISEYELECKNRHRAGDDAKVLMDFFEIGPRMHGMGFWNTVQDIIS